VEKVREDILCVHDQVRRGGEREGDGKEIDVRLAVDVFFSGLEEM